MPAALCSIACSLLLAACLAGVTARVIVIVIDLITLAGLVILLLLLLHHQHDGGSAQTLDELPLAHAHFVCHGQSATCIVLFVGSAVAGLQEKSCTLISLGQPAGGADVLLLQGRGDAQTRYIVRETGCSTGCQYAEKADLADLT